MTSLTAGSTLHLFYDKPEDVTIQSIGAGTITANFDGVRKHRTRVGRGAFLGVDTMLVAPVEVGDGDRVIALESW